MPSPRDRREVQNSLRNPRASTSESSRRARGAAAAANSQGSGSSSDAHAHSGAGDLTSQFGEVRGSALPQPPRTPQRQRPTLHRASPRNPAHQSSASTGSPSDRTRTLTRAGAHSGRVADRTRTLQGRELQPHDAESISVGSLPGGGVSGDHLANVERLDGPKIDLDAPKGLAFAIITPQANKPQNPRLVWRNIDAAAAPENEVPDYSFDMGFVISAKPGQIAPPLGNLVASLASDFNQKAPPDHPRMMESLVLERDQVDRSRWSITRIEYDPHCHHRIYQLEHGQELVTLRSPLLTSGQPMLARRYIQSVWRCLLAHYAIQLWHPCHLNVHISFRSPLSLDAQKRLVSHLLQNEDELVYWSTQPTAGQPGVTASDLYKLKGLRRNWKDSLVLQDKSEAALVNEVARIPTAQRLRQYFQAGNQRQPGRLYLAELNEDGSTDLRYWPASLDPDAVMDILGMAAGRVANAVFPARNV